MRAIMRIELSDVFTLEEPDGPKDAVTHGVAVNEEMILELGVDAESFKRAFQNTIGTSLMPVFEKLAEELPVQGERVRQEHLKDKARIKAEREEEEAKLKAEADKAKAKTNAAKQSDQKQESQGTAKGN